MRFMLIKILLNEYITGAALYESETGLLRPKISPELLAKL